MHAARSEESPTETAPVRCLLLGLLRSRFLEGVACFPLLLAIVTIVLLVMSCVEGLASIRICAVPSPAGAAVWPSSSLPPSLRMCACMHRQHRQHELCVLCCSVVCARYCFYIAAAKAGQRPVFFPASLQPCYGSQWICAPSAMPCYAMPRGGPLSGRCSRLCMHPALWLRGVPRACSELFVWACTPVLRLQY